ncbi:MAG: TrkA family potassium uptake protein [Actinomycetota bacterium]
MHVLIMGNGRVGSELADQLLASDHDVTVIDKNPEAFYTYPLEDGIKQVVGLGFDRDVLESAGIRDADAFVAVSSGDNSNIVSARVALEYYHVPRVVARIYDPRRAEIYERLNIPTVATTKWGVKQIQLMLMHVGKEIRESMGGGDLLRMRVPIPGHLIGKPATSLNVPGNILVAGVSRGGSGFLPTPETMLKDGDFLVLMLTKDGMDSVDQVLAAPAGEHA